MPTFPTLSHLERSLGILYYSTPGKGIGGKIRVKPEDFLVEEITPEGIIVNESLKSLSRGRGPYTLAVLKKTSRDLLPTIALLQRRLSAKVSFAGIKDRRAVTYQLISISRPLTEPIRLNNLEVWSVGTSKWGVRPGELKGNRFTITIRSLNGELTPAETLCCLSWLPGYFGHQRFGTTRPNTHKVGKHIMRGEFESAVREFLAEPYESEPRQIFHFRQNLKATWDLQSALSSIPPFLLYEREVIGALLSGADHMHSLESLPKRLLRLFVDAYQSYLFNLALSERWANYGLNYIDLGDTVSILDNSLNPSRSIKVTRSNLEKLRKLVESKRAVLLMPVPGSDLHLEGINYQIYSKILDSEKISPCDFANVMGMKFWGDMRPAVFYPSGLEILDHSGDELNPGKTKITVRFILPRGFYATILLREIMKPEDPKSSGLNFIRDLPFKRFSLFSML
ncbi:MAG: tRNA pseudouridine(13) synthase TruD, partial [Candidatus Methanomethyliales bacterium]|nr:tRNA pseudouridine(13) synthase TruD [Candidatus Methanomethylicales archaeon]